MAMYEFECEKCGHQYTIRESFEKHDQRKSEPRCPECGSRKTRQVLETVHVQTTKKS